MRKVCLFLTVVVVMLFGGFDNSAQVQSTVDRAKDSIEGKTNVSATASYNISELKDIPVDFSLQDAKDSGMLVLENGTITSGLNFWHYFLDNVRSGVSDVIFIANYYELGDASRYSHELYEQIKDDYPIINVHKLEFDGKKYHMSYYEYKESQLYSYEFNYLIERTGHLEKAAKADHFFALVNDEKLSYNDIMWSMLSSNSKERVSFQFVILENVALKD